MWPLLSIKSESAPKLNRTRAAQSLDGDWLSRVADNSNGYPLFSVSARGKRKKESRIQAHKSFIALFIMTKHNKYGFEADPPFSYNTVV